MRHDVKADKARSDKYLVAIKRLLGETFIGEASESQDMHEATDLVLTVRSLTVACRVREGDYIERYPHDITIRYSRSSGNKTEWDKIAEGFADYMVYAFGDGGSQLVRWVIVDLHRFRTQLDWGPPKWKLCKNGDVSSNFRAIDASTLDPGVIRCASPSYWDRSPRCGCLRCKSSVAA